MSESAKLRPMLAAVAWKMVKDRPLVGVGLGQYTHHSGEFIAERTIDMPLDSARPYIQHNFVFSLLTETGLLGTLPFLALLISWAVTAKKLWLKDGVSFEVRRTGMIFLVTFANYVTNGMFHDVTVIPMVNLLLFFLAGVVMSAALEAESCVDWPRLKIARATRTDQRQAVGDLMSDLARWPVIPAVQSIPRVTIRKPTAESPSRAYHAKVSCLGGDDGHDICYIRRLAPAANDLTKGP